MCTTRPGRPSDVVPLTRTCCTAAVPNSALGSACPTPRRHPADSPVPNLADSLPRVVRVPRTTPHRRYQLSPPPSACSGSTSPPRQSTSPTSRRDTIAFSADAAAYPPGAGQRRGGGRPCPAGRLVVRAGAAHLERRRNTRGRQRHQRASRICTTATNPIWTTATNPAIRPELRPQPCLGCVAANFCSMRQSLT
jgi:hypothetical protein